MSSSAPLPLPSIGYGTWDRPGKEAYQGVLWALEAGYRHIDTAQQYENEAEVGQALRDSGLARNEVFITTKVSAENYGPGEVLRSTRASLERLGIEQVDLLLLHWPAPHDRVPMEQYVTEFALTLDQGLARTLGVSNFTVRQLGQAQQILGHRKLWTNQVECHVFLQNRAVVTACRKRQMPVTAYCPLARGAVRPDPVLNELGQLLGATPSQIALAFLLHEGHIVIPSSSSQAHIKENLAAGQLELNEEQLSRLRRLDCGQRLVDGPWCPQWDQ